MVISAPQVKRKLARPDQRDHEALGGLDHGQCERRRQRGPEQRLYGCGDVEAHIDRNHHRNEQMAEQQHDQIGRKIVRTLHGPIPPARGTAGHGLQEAAEQLCLAAGWAAAGKASLERLPEVRGGLVEMGHDDALAWPAPPYISVMLLSLEAYISRLDM